MMTVVTTITMAAGSEPEWDRTIRERFASAHGRHGWVSGQLLVPDEEPSTRVIIGTWRTREHWEAWHRDPAFLEQRAALEGLEVARTRMQWFTVVEEGREGEG